MVNIDEEMVRWEDGERVNLGKSKLSTDATKFEISSQLGFPLIRETAQHW
ncbi:hypothetical protein [Moorena producens]